MSVESGKNGSKGSVCITEVLEIYLDRFAEEAEKKP